MMGFEDIRRVLENHQVDWDNPTPVEMDGQPSARPSNSPEWITMTINHGDSMTAGVGSDPCVRRTGLLMFQVRTPELQGSAKAAKIADELAKHWEYWQNGEIETLAASVSRVGRIEESSGTHYQYNVTLPFRAG